MLELESARKTLESVADALEGLGVNYWIDSGTLLSAYRDGTINIYDHDIDITVFEDEISTERLADIIRAFWLVDFNMIYDPHLQRAAVLLRNRYSIMLDLKLCYRDSEHVWHYCWQKPSPIPVVYVYPRKFFNNLGLIELLGRRYPCPQPVEEYLLYHYGEDWRLFKVRPEDAKETDLTWDYMRDSPCSMTLDKFNELKEKPTLAVGEDNFEPLTGFWTKPPMGTRILYRCSVCFEEVIGKIRAPTDIERERLDTSAKQMSFIDTFPCEHRDKLQLIEYLKGE